MIPSYTSLALVVCPLLFASLTGCTTSYVISTTPDSLSCPYDVANARLKGRDATIEFINGQTIEAADVSLSTDSVRFHDARGTRHLAYDLSGVKQIDSRDPGRGTIEGLGIGALSGAATGLAILFSARRNEPNVLDAPGTGYAVLGGGLGLLGGTFGALAGHSIGHADLFTFKTTQPAGRTVEQPLPMDSSFTRRYVLSAEIASSFSGSDFQGGWRTTYALQVGLGRTFSKSLTVFANFDYYKYHPAPASGNSGLTPRSAQRQDFALYGSVQIARVLVIGAGIYYTTSDQVYMVSPFQNFVPFPWHGSGFSGVRAFSLIGLSYDIHLGDVLFIPVGLFFRTNENVNSALPIYGKIGAGLIF